MTTTAPAPTAGVSRRLAAMGPAFIVAVGYVDPGNWGTDIAAGAEYGYTLLWVLVLANGIALFLQYLSAKLGIATGSHLAELLGARLGRTGRAIALAATAVILLATEVAEFLGVVLALHLLLGGPLVLSIVLGVVLVLTMLSVASGNRALERGIALLLGVIAAVFVVQVWLSDPGLTPFTGLAPSLPPGAAAVAVALMGATVMPHNLFLHSGVVHWSRPVERSAALRSAMVCAAIALNGALLINAAILIVAAATRSGAGVPETIGEAALSLEPALGSFSVFAFGIGLLAAGLASTATSGIAGQFAIEGLTRFRPPLLARRCATLVPAVLLLLVGVGEVQALMVSQLVLGLALPLVIFALIRLTDTASLMGEMRIRPVTRRLAYCVLGFVVIADIRMLLDLFGG
ncbi:Nramp family divalent metal transporter [Rhizohabitans arisaemae]|uniref:Nramp family divalent metal transporter n=1 Tax=Rhizohabitans arisaemae TaxID=2720610 RepID=UPI0024B0623F|nr:Nramp family divalent metal transporter [Rhizohabitans arisaemae]